MFPLLHGGINLCELCALGDPAHGLCSKGQCVKDINIRYLVLFLGFSKVFVGFSSFFFLGFSKVFLGCSKVFLGFSLQLWLGLPCFTRDGLVPAVQMGERDTSLVILWG